MISHLYLKTLQPVLKRAKNFKICGLTACISQCQNYGTANESNLKVIDYRSDTLSQPTQEMRDAMFRASVGDDVYREDLTVIELEKRMAVMTGMEDAMFVPSGTMGNLISIMAHCSNRASEIILGDESHIHMSEQGGIAQLAGIHSRTFRTNRDGTFDITEVIDKIRPANNFHFPVTRLLCIENTHNRCGGTVLPLSFLQQVWESAKTVGLPVHVDGARITNAAVKLNIPLGDLTRYCDTVCICLSKGLSAPVGSVVCGPLDFIDSARYIRKGLGGGLRQSGFLAAAGLVALDRMVETLSEDHRRTYEIAKGFQEIRSEAIVVDLNLVHTNIILVECNPRITSPEILCQRLAQVTDDEQKHLGQKIVLLARPYGKNRLRMITCRNRTDEDVHLTISKLKYVLSQL